MREIAVVDSRKKRIADQLRLHDLDAFVLSSPENVFYVSDIPARHMEINPVLFIVSNQHPSWVLVDAQGDTTLVTWNLALIDFKPLASEVRGIASRDDALRSIADVIAKKRLAAARVGIEARCSLFLYERLCKSFPEAKFEISEVFSHVRRVKTDAEIKRMTRAAEITSEAIVSLFESARAGLTDYELSGGERQRVNIARALAPNPKLLIADEPLTMLDASQRLNILSLLTRIKNERSLTILLITHDLTSGKIMSDRTAIMYKGKIVEIGSTNKVLSRPEHQYTRLILESTPRLEPSANV